MSNYQEIGSSSFDRNEIQIKTDVLVIGGGMAGFFAAIKASELGADVILIDKSYAGKAGGTHFAEGDIQFFRPEKGHDLDAWLKEITLRCEYLNNREWDEIVLKESEKTYNDLVSWGVKFYEKKGELSVNKPGIMRSYVKGSESQYETISMIHREFSPKLRKKALSSGAKILDKVFICELIKQDERVVGAIGFHVISGELYMFNAKAVVIATGSSNFKLGSWPTHYWTGDGQAMAYRAGVEIAGEEFSGGMMLFPKKMADSKVLEQKEKKKGISGEINDVLVRFPFYDSGNRGWFRPFLNAEGGSVSAPSWEAHCGRAPLYVDVESYSPDFMEWLRNFYSRVGTALPEKIGFDIFKGGMVQYQTGMMGPWSIFAGSGIWPTNKNCATTLSGLYAAGNSCATMASGAQYAGMGCGLTHAAVTGARVGLAAAAYASESKDTKINKTELRRLKTIVLEPVVRRGGFRPGWFIQLLQSMVTPYYVFHIKHGERLQATLTLVEFLNNHLVPKLMANDAHDWRRAYEAKNMALIAEMRLRSSLFRTESRGGHFREDYPRRDDPTWLAWVKINEEKGEMKLFKEPVPEEWWPDLDKPYEERYPAAFPGE